MYLLYLNVSSCVEHTLAYRVSALAKAFARMSCSNCGCRVSALVKSVSSKNRFCRVSVLAERWLLCRARMGGCRVSVQFNLSHVRRLLSCPSSFFFFTVWAALELLCYVAREKSHGRAHRFVIYFLYFLLHFPSCDQKGNLSYAL